MSWTLPIEKLNFRVVFFSSSLKTRQNLIVDHIYIAWYEILMKFKREKWAGWTVEWGSQSLLLHIIAPARKWTGNAKDNIMRWDERVERLLDIELWTLVLITDFSTAKDCKNKSQWIWDSWSPVFWASITTTTIMNIVNKIFCYFT